MGRQGKPLGTCGRAVAHLPNKVEPKGGAEDGEKGDGNKYRQSASPTVGKLAAGGGGAVPPRLWEGAEPMSIGGQGAKCLASEQAEEGYECRAGIRVQATKAQGRRRTETESQKGQQDK